MMAFRTKIRLSLIALTLIGQTAVGFAQGDKASTKAQESAEAAVLVSGDELPGFDDLKLDVPASADETANNPAKAAGSAAKTAAKEPGERAPAVQGQEELGGLRLARDARVPEAAEREETRATLSDKAVRRVIAEHTSDIRYCHERSGKRRKLKGGELTLHFTVTPSGSAEGIRITASDRALLKLDVCIKQRVQAWRFPNAEAATAVEYPILLGVTGLAAR